MRNPCRVAPIRPGGVILCPRSQAKLLAPKTEYEPLLDEKRNTVDWVVIAFSYSETGRDYHRLLHGSDEKKGYFKVVNSKDGPNWATYYKSQEAYEEHCSSMQVSAKRHTTFTTGIRCK